MAKIEVYRTHIEIHNYEPGDSKQIERRFGVYDPIYHKLYPKGRYYDEATKTLYLPRGTAISYLENIFQTEAVVKSDLDPIGKVGQLKLRYKPRDEVQHEALQFMLSLGKYSNNANYTMLSLNLPTGKGKTYCSITALSYLGLRSIIITNSNEWLSQWKAFFLEYTDIQSDEIYYIAGSPTLMKLYNRDISKYKVVLCTHATLKSYASRNGWQAVHEFFKYMQFGCKVYDEAHLSFDNMFMIDCFTNTWLTYYVTATPNRSDEKEDKIYTGYFENVPSISLFDENVDPHTSYIGIRYNSNPDPIQISECRNKFGMDRNKYTNYLVHQENFYKMLRIILDMALKKKGKHLFYIGTNEAIMIVKDWIYENYPELIGQVGVFTSITEKESKKEQLDKKIILTTTKSAGAAVDIPGLVETVVLAEPFKSKVLAQQSFGRTRAANTVYKDIVDTGFFFTKRFYEQKKSVFMKYATDCKEITIRNSELDERSKKIEDLRSRLSQPMVFYEQPRDMELNTPMEFF